MYPVLLLVTLLVALLVYLLLVANLLRLALGLLYQLVCSCPGAGQHHQHKLVEIDVAVIVLVSLGKH